MRMATIEVNITGADYSKHLAATLTDLEFELLVRERIKVKFAAMHERDDNLAESYNSCSFTYDWNDKSTWSVGIGKSYNSRGTSTGQVLNVSVEDAYAAYSRQERNKLSLLLGAPDSTTDSKPVSGIEMPF